MISEAAIGKVHTGRVALVTGAARGIGQAIAVGLAQRGAAIVLADIGDLAETSELISRIGSPATALTLDISDPAAIDEATARVAAERGHVDILVNNAGLVEAVTWDELDLERWQRVLSVNLTGTMLMCKAFLPLMRGRGWGRVINIASATVASGSLVSIAYRSSKMGVIGLTRALSSTLGPDGITINAVLPSLTRTAMAEKIPESVAATSLARQAIHRMADPDDIAGVVFMLAADEAGWVTGQSIMASGGHAFGL